VVRIDIKDHEVRATAGFDLELQTLCVASVVGPAHQRIAFAQHEVAIQFVRMRGDVLSDADEPVDHAGFDGQRCVGHRRVLALAPAGVEARQLHGVASQCPVRPAVPSTSDPHRHLIPPCNAGLHGSNDHSAK
jgi:hypothetical protein